MEKAMIPFVEASYTITIPRIKPTINRELMK
jgi:hypothetical protein